MRTVIHLGYPRTATTLLQRKIFCHDDRLNYLGKPWRASCIEALERRILTCSYKDIDSDVSAISEALSGFMSQRTVNLLSHEGFSRATRHLQPGGIDTKETFSKLTRVFSYFGDVSFVLVVRRHLDLLWSNYNVFRAAWRSYGLDLQTLSEILEGKLREQSFILDNFKFFAAYNALVEEVGDERVKLMFYEDLKVDGNSFLLELYSFLGLEPPPLAVDALRETINSSRARTTRYRMFKLLRQWLPSVRASIGNGRGAVAPTQSPYAKWKADVSQAWREARFEREVPLIAKTRFLDLERQICAYYEQDLLRFRTTPYWEKLVQYKYLV